MKVTDIVRTCIDNIRRTTAETSFELKTTRTKETEETKLQGEGILQFDNVL